MNPVSIRPRAPLNLSPTTKLSGLLGVLLLLATPFTAAYYPARLALAWLLGVLGVAALGHFLHRERRTRQRGRVGRATRFRAGTALHSGALLGALALLNVLAVHYNRTWDLTANQRFTLSEPTRKVLSQLREVVSVTAFVADTGGQRAQLQDRLEAYAAHSPNLTVTLVDPARHSTMARQYDVPATGAILLESAGLTVRATDPSEQGITNAVVRVTRRTPKVVCGLSGHGEHGLRDEQRSGYAVAAKALEGNGFQVRELLLSREGEVPEQCAVLVAAGPTRPLPEQELAALRRYRDKGGQLLLLLDPTFDSGLEALASEWGATPRDDIVVDPLSRGLGGSRTAPILADYPDHPLTRDFSQATFFPLARSLELADPPPDGIAAHPLARTTPQAWGESDLSNAEASFEPTADFKGPLTVAALLEQPAVTARPAGRLLVVGDSDFANNANFRFAGNANLFQRAVSYLGREEDLVAVPPRAAQAIPFALTSAQSATLLYGSVVMAPLTLLVSGLLIWWKRKHL